jgi:hypothetical protein
LFILACPIMHSFMHRGHGHKHGPSRQDNLGPGSGNKGDAP